MNPIKNTLKNILVTPDGLGQIQKEKALRLLIRICANEAIQEYKNFRYIKTNAQYNEIF